MERVRAAVYRERPMFNDLLRDGLVHPLAIEWVEHGDLIVNPRTGKLRRIVDNRLTEGQ
jgi:phenylacetate-CoA ligase